MLLKLLKILVVLWSLSFNLFATVHAAENEISYAFGDWVPMSYMEQGKLKGLYAEILSVVLERELQLKIIPEPLPWKRAQLIVKKGRADILLTIATPERLSYAVKSEVPFYEMPLNVFTYARHPQWEKILSIKSAYDIKRLGLTAVTNRGNGWHQDHIEKEGVKTELVASEKEALHFIKKRQADITIDALVPTLYLLDKEDLKRDVVATPVTFGPLKFYLLMSKKSKHLHLMPKINKIFARLKKSGEIDGIIKRYSTSP